MLQTPLHDRIDGYRAALTEVEAVALEALREAKARLLAAETSEDAERMIRSLDRCARVIQRGVLIHQRLDLDLAREARARQAGASAEAETRAETRKGQVRCVLERQAYAEAPDRNRAQAILGAVDELLREDGFLPDFAERPIETYIARLRYDVGLDAAPPPEPHGGPVPPPRGVLWRPRSTGLFYPPAVFSPQDEDNDDEDEDLYEDSA